MRSKFALGLALVFCGLSAPSCEAGQGVFAKIHRAKINLIKRVLHIGQGRTVTSSDATTTYSTPVEYPAPVVETTSY